MEEALELGTYLPLSFRAAAEQDYIAFLWEAFETNHTNEKYQFAFLAYHMLCMSFAYFKIWQIKRTRPNDFLHSMVGFNKDIERDIMRADSPFAFWCINESGVLRFFKIIGCDNDKIGNYASLVKYRNEAAHANGNIFFNSGAAFNAKVTDVLRMAAEIQTHSRPIIEQTYRDFLINNHDSEEREYPDDTDQIREVLIHQNYMSQKDIEICQQFDLSTIEPETNSPGIFSLHANILFYDDER